jgi:hypothetical protein
MNEFKLIAIRPLVGCHESFVKNLRAGEIYNFYQGYKFEKENGEVNRITYTRTLPAEFFAPSKKDIDISVSAVVGKNGSGKSSLTELLYAAIFLLSVQEGSLELKKDTDIEQLIAELANSIKYKTEELNGLFDSTGKIPVTFYESSSQPVDHEQIVINQVYTELRIKQELGELAEKSKLLSAKLRDRQQIRERIKVEIFFQISRTFFKLKIDDVPGQENCRIQIVPSSHSDDENPVYKEKILNNTRSNRELKIENLLDMPLNLSDHFFYSIVLNYSHYALNSNDVGMWIEELFHKNDGYQTPIVLNPMRDEGIIDINTENYLVRSRLLANIFSSQETKAHRILAEGKEAKRILIELDADKSVVDIEKNFKSSGDKAKYWNVLNEVFLKNKERNNETEWDITAENYIFRKLFQMADKYPPYKKYKGFERLDMTIFQQYLDDLLKDTSHIAYKFHQAINFLKFNYAKTYVDAKTGTSIDEIELALEAPAKIKDIIYLLPPSFLKIDIFFSNEDLSNTFNKLSSGEKQKIYSISSITYHLRYLDSVVVRSGLPHKYENINLLFDEIELYYHPELQRTFVSDLLDSILRMSFSNIKRFNCIFLTHSPFILSDIPSCNILALVDGFPDADVGKKRSFGANVHDLLADEFYMKNGFMGEWAKRTINDVISFLDLKDFEQRLGGIEKIKTDIELSKKHAELKSRVIEKNLDYYIRVISIIGEDIIKQNLIDYWNEVIVEKKISN